jgi:hypothetical protein
MEKLTAALNRKVFGVPVYVIAFIFAAGILWYAIRLRPSESDSTGEVEPSENDGTDAGFDASTDGEQPVFTVTSATPVGSVISTNNDNNEAWGQRAISYLASLGVSAGDSGIAIRKYLDGENLTYEEGQLRDKAVLQLGIPPESITPGKTSTYKGPAAKQGEPPLTHEVRGKSDDSPQELSRLYYGMQTADAVRLIRGANTTLTEPYPIGASVRIPGFHKPHYFKATRHVRGLYQIAAKNSTTADRILALNPGLTPKDFPVKVGRQIRIK